tara:strand:+ start:905 stop:2524 length:1620 start_codon:yes stop_codon:yes gene_type:complete
MMASGTAREELHLREILHLRGAVRRQLFGAQRQVFDHWRAADRLAQHEASRVRETPDFSSLTAEQLGEALGDVAPRPISCKTPRRAAKTTFAAGLQLDDALRYPGSHYPYIALTGPAAKQLAWPVFKWWDRRLMELEGVGLGIKFNEGELSWWLPNGPDPDNPYKGGSNGKLWGSDREDLQRNLYGGKNRIVVVDEGALWKTSLRSFYQETLEPTVTDLLGLILVIGAPADWLKGFFWDLSRPEVELRQPGWDHFEWDTEDNPHIKVELALKHKKWVQADPHYRNKPWFRRQWKGEWVAEAADQVFRYCREINGTHADWPDPYGERYVLSVDTGGATGAGMAYVVGSWHPRKHPNLVVRESLWERECNLDQIASRLESFQERYDGLHMLGDHEAAQLLYDLRTLHGIGIARAEKHHKLQAIETVNTMFDNGTCQVLDPDGANAPLSLDLENMRKAYSRDTKIAVDDDGNRQVVQGGDWEIDKKSAPGHCGHAFLYMARHCYPHVYRPAKPPPGTEDKLMEQALAEVKRKTPKKRWRRRR